MKRAYLLGYPVGHSISPPLYNATFRAMAIDAVCEARATPPAELAAVVAGLRAADCFGASVTIPHKEAVIPLLDEVEAAAAAIGAVNCIANRDGRLAGYNTDRAGFLRSLQESGFTPTGARAVVLGAGGSARAVVAALVDAGVSVLLSGRDKAKVGAVANVLRSHFKADASRLGSLGWEEESFATACRAADLIVNCTPLGMWGSGLADQSPLDPALIRRGAVVLDLVYNPPKTPLLRAAAAAGAKPVSGLDMLVYQGAEAVRLWTGREPPVGVMKSAALQAISERR